MCIYIYVCVCSYRYSICAFITSFACLTELREQSLIMFDPSNNTEWNPAGHQINKKKHHFFLRWWLPKVDVLPWKHLCLSFSQLWFCFLHPCPSKLPRNWRPNWGMRSWRWWSILSQWCSIAAAWLDHLGSNSIRNRMRDSWKAGKNREYIIEVPSR